MNTGYPLVTVAIRSYLRLHHTLKLIETCLQQDYGSFEILVIEQSEIQREQFRGDLERVKKDPRVRVMEYPKLGNIGARNKAVQQARGEIILFIDDDDLPADTHWITNHAKNYEDPLCVAVTGREIWRPDEDPAPENTRKNYRKCLRYSWLKMPRARVRHTRRLVGVTCIQGGNTSIRKSVLDRVGPWMDDVANRGHEERSFDFKFQRIKKAGEHYVYDPTAVMLRRFDLDGGLNRRKAGADKILHDELYYSHYVIRPYFPFRFYICYPAYLGLAAWRTYRFMTEYQPGEKWHHHPRALLKNFIPALKKVWLRPETG